MVFAIKNITCNLERNKIKYKQLNHIAITPILTWKTLKGKTTNNRSIIINLDQHRPSRAKWTSHHSPPGTLQWSISSLFIGFITCKYYGHQYHGPPKPCLNLKWVLFIDSFTKSSLTQQITSTGNNQHDKTFCSSYFQRISVISKTHVKGQVTLAQDSFTHTKKNNKYSWLMIELSKVHYGG